MRAGGELRTALGVLAIDAVDAIDERDIGADDARRASHASRDELVAALRQRPEGTLYRIALRPAGADPRLALSERAALDGDDRAAIGDALARFDRAPPARLGAP